MSEAQLRGQALLRCLRRCGWSDLRIDQTVAHDIVRQWGLNGRLSPAECEFYNTVLADVGVD